MKSASPVSIALRGIPSYLAVSGSWTKTVPASAFIALNPRVPSVPVPDRMMQIASGPLSLARERKKKSTGSLSPRG